MTPYKTDPKKVPLISYIPISVVLGLSPKP